MITCLKSSELKSTVKQKKSALVLFSGNWCPDCRNFKPIWNKWTSEKVGPIYEIDTPRGGSEWDEWGIDEIPTVTAFSRGKEIGRVHGAITEADLDRLWSKVREKQP